ncbi:MAG TPA: TMEM175 family protein [bacterium]|nr:TMEM175 family protein [bacterium]
MDPKEILDPYDASSIAALSDGIFGVALTLLVLDVHLPGTSTDHLARQLLSLWPRFYSFGLSFAVVAAYWVAYHRLLAHIVAYDRPLLLRNFAFLAFVVLTPFPTSLVGEGYFVTQGDARVAWIVYAGTLALVGLTLAWLWQCATARNLTNPKLTPSAAEYLLIRTLVSPLIFVLSMGVAATSAPLAPWTLVLLIPAQALVAQRYAQAIARPR